MIVLLKLLLTHFIGDFVLQPKSWVEKKERDKIKSPELYFHALVHGALTMLLLWDIHYWPLALILTVVHGVIDILKSYAQNKNNRPRWFLLDQSLHVASIVILWIVWTKPDFNATAEWLSEPDFWIYASALVFVTVVAAISIQAVMTNWSSELKDGETNSLTQAGRYIGILERLFVFVFVVTGYWNAIGFLLAAKSIFRFGDLRRAKDRKLTEYILIGTLLSFGIAMATGLLVLGLTGQRIIYQ